MTLDPNERLDAVKAAVGSQQWDRALQLLATDSGLGLDGRNLTIELHDRLMATIREHLAGKQWQDSLRSFQMLVQLEGRSRSVEELETEFWSAFSPQVSDWLSEGKPEEVAKIVEMGQGVFSDSLRLRAIQESLDTAISAKKLASSGRFAEAETQLVHWKDANRESWVVRMVESIRIAHEKAKTLLTELQTAADGKRWQEVSRLVESLLGVANRHPIALQWGQRARAELAAMGMRPEPSRETGSNMISALDNTGSHHSGKIQEASPGRRFPTLWIDGVGGYLLVDSEEVVLGQAAPGNQVELMIVGDLSRRAAAIRRSGESYLLQPLQSVFVNSIPVDRATLLRDGDHISVGPRVQLRYSRPSGLSATARLELTSRHRWSPSVDGVLLVADNCVIGPSNHAHVLCPFWSNDVILFRHRNQWMCKSKTPLEVEGKTHSGTIVVPIGKRITGLDFSMTLE